MRIPIPGLSREVPSGDLLKQVIEKIAEIQPCGGCRRRQEKMNRALQFVPLRELSHGRPTQEDPWPEPRKRGPG